MRRKQFLAFLLAAAMVVPNLGNSVYASEITVSAETAGETASEETSLSVYEQLKADLAIVIDSEGMTSAELLAEGAKYENGDGVVKFLAKAMAYYEAALVAAEDGSEDAVAAQAAIDALNAYKDEVNAEGVQGTVFTLYREGVTASQQGDYETTFCRYYDDAFFFEEEENRGIGGLGELYRDGTGVEKDIAKVVSIFTYCAEVLGKGNGYTALGLMYQAEEGTYEGIEHSEEKAMQYFLWSFDTEKCTSTDFKGPRYAGCLYDSGYTLDDGTEVEPCYLKAAECFEIAKAGNGRTFDGTACVYLGEYYTEGRTCEHADGTVHVIEADMEKAVENYEKAVSDKNVHSTMLGIPKAYLVLGQCYENGEGVEADFGIAIDYYKKASAAAQDNLDLVNTGSSDEEMEEIKAAADEALERLCADTSAYAGDYTYGDLTITIGEASDCTITDGTTTISGYFTYTAKTNNWTKQTTVTVTFNPATVAAMKDAGMMASYWDGTGTIANGAFAPTLAVNANEVADFTVETVADAESPTGFMTTFTVADDGYANVYVYGNWTSCKMVLTDPDDPSSYDDTEYSPYEWENGNYYNGSSAIAMTLDEETGLWTLSVPLASGTMKFSIIHDMFAESDADSISQNQTTNVGYDSEKQSESFDWTICYYDETIAGTTDITVEFEGTAKGGTVQLAVYLPKNYDASKQYPVIYYIPGGMTTYAKVFDGNKTNSILDHLIADGTMEETVLVGIERTDSPYLVEDIIPYVEANYSVYTDSAHRALYAVSMGSAAATTIWLDEETTELFDYYGFFSGADKTTFNTSEYGDLDADYTAALAGAHITIGGGTLDFNMFTGDNNSASITQLGAWMDNYGIDHTTLLAGGAHNGVTWQPLEKAFFSSLWKHDYESKVTKPTYTEQGYTTHTCTICGDSYVDSYTDVIANPISRLQGFIAQAPVVIKNIGVSIVKAVSSWLSKLFK